MEGGENFYALDMTVRYRMKLLRAGEFRLDAGSMMGLIPKVVWNRPGEGAIVTDEKNRVTLQHNCVLLERADELEGAGGMGGRFVGGMPKLVLLETGTGDKLDDKSREIFALERRTVVDALAQAGCDAKDVGGVVVSHLHFDHAGGLTRLCRSGEKADWTGVASSFGAGRGDHGVKMTFGNAKVVTQRREWEDARAGKSVMTKTYFEDHLEPMAECLGTGAGGGLVLVDSLGPYGVGVVAGKNQLPDLDIEFRMTEVFPGVRVFRVPGHTWGQQATVFTDVLGREVVFTPDVMPTAWHLGQAYSLAYDVEPYTSMLSKTWLLKEAAQRGWLLLLNHEPGHPLFKVKENGKGWYALERAEL